MGCEGGQLEPSGLKVLGSNLEVPGGSTLAALEKKHTEMHFTAGGPHGGYGFLFTTSPHVTQRTCLGVLSLS